MSELKPIPPELRDEIELSMSDQIDRIRQPYPSMDEIRAFIGAIIVKAYTAGYQAAQQEQSEGDKRWQQ